MIATFLEPGGDADFLVATTNGFWAGLSGGVAVATDFVHGGHIKSIQIPASATLAENILSKDDVVAQAGGRVSFFNYFVALPTAAKSQIFGFKSTGGINPVFNLYLTSAGILQLWKGTSSQLGGNGPVLTTGRQYRISMAYTITSTTVNSIRVYVDSVLYINVNNITLTSILPSALYFGRSGIDATLDIRLSDIYADKSTALTDPGNIWVTVKRPNANGTTNGFTTQIGSGGSGVGSGHSPQVNERALNTANGWSMIGAGSAVTEEYNIEGKAGGDIDISLATIIDWLGWASMSSLVAETVNMILDGASVAQAITSTISLYVQLKGSATYPAGTGADIGIQTDTSLTTVSLYECGIIVAYIPPVDPLSISKMFLVL